MITLYSYESHDFTFLEISFNLYLFILNIHFKASFYFAFLDRVSLCCTG
jgi:hypothetical protein